MRWIFLRSGICVQKPRVTCSLLAFLILYLNLGMMTTMDLLALSSPVARHLSSLRATLPRHKHLPSPLCCKSTASPRFPAFKPSIKSSENLTPKLLASQMPATTMGVMETDAMELLLKERVVFLGNDIDDFVADVTISQLLLLDAQDPTRDIRLFINCPAGSLSATMAIYDVLQLVRADVSTVVIGISASTASIILGGGTKGKRFAMPNARIMIHQPLGGASGAVSNVEIQMRELMNNKENVVRIMSGFTGRTVEQVEKDIDRDCYMSPIEAVEYGIIDGVIDGESIIPLVSVPERGETNVKF